MSFTSEYLKLRKKREEEEKAVSRPTTTSTSSNSSFTDEYLALREKRMNEIEQRSEDIAPILLGTKEDKKTYGWTSAKPTTLNDDVLDSVGVLSPMETRKVEQKQKEEKAKKWFKAGAFEDGYDGIGDIVSSVGSTAGDVALGILKGVGNLGEGISDLAWYGVSGASKLVGADSVSKEAKEIAEHNTINEFLEPYVEKVDKNSFFGGKMDGIAEGLGYVGGIIATAGIGGAAGLSSNAVTALVTGTTFASSAGSGISEAYQGGATDAEAVTYGVFKGAVDAGTELLFGGLGKTVKGLGVSKGISSLDDVFAKKISSKISNRFFKTATEYGVKASAEGVEEVLAGIGAGIGKKLTYMSEEDLLELIENEDLLDQFVMGAVVSGIAQGGDFVSSVKNDTDFVTGLTTQEETVVDKEFENRVAEKEKDGKKLTNKEKNKIYDKVVEDMDKGYISIDTIEEVLGGNDYKAYKELVDNEENLKAELAELQKLEYGKMNDIQHTRLNELKGMNLTDTTKRDELRAKLDNTLSPMLKNSRLVESYNEKARKGQAFEADLSQYTGKQRDAVERAVKSGVLNNTNRSHQLVDILSKIESDKGIVFDYANNEKLNETGFAIEGKTVNGFANKSTGTVTLNVQSSKAWESTVGHEITHILEGTNAYNELRSALFEFAESRGELESKREALTELYKDIETDIESELTADLVGEYLFSDTDFINRLTGNRTLFQKIYDEIKYLCRVATGKELTEIEKVREKFDKVWKEFSTEGINEELNEATDAEVDDVQYSIAVEDKSTLDSLNEQVAKGEYNAETNPNGGYYVTYKSMSYWGTDENGNAILRSPMAEYVDGELSNAYLIPKDKSKLNWYQATETLDEKTGLPSGLMVKVKKEGNKSFTYLPAAENQDLIKDDWSNLYFNLQKKVLKNGKWVKSDVPARYNPYEHSSNSMLNDQFSAAYLRDNLVTVKMYVPISEDNGAFRAKWSKDPTGWADWKTGTVAGKINKQKDLQRKVYLSRYAAPVEIVPDSEVAQAYKEYLEGTDVTIPDNVVSPNLLNELKKAGVPITESGKIKYSVSKDIENFDNSLYNEIELPVEERNRVESEALTWNADKRNQLITQTLTNDITYRYMIDDKSNVHIYSREESVNIHERKKEYDNANGEKPDTVIEELGIKQGSNGEYLNISKNGRNQGKDDANDSSSIRREGRSNRAGYSKDRVNAYRKPKVTHWHFNDDGSADVTYSDGTQEKENIAPIKEASQKGGVFFDGKNQKFSLSADSEGNQLSKEQQEFFKDSKVRDENGNLLAVYHGSKVADFNTFKYSPLRQTGTDFGEAYYFTSDYKKASGYSYDVTKDARVKKYQEERRKLLDRFLETKSEADKHAFLNVKVEGKNLYELMNDENYTTGGEVKKVYLNLKNPLIVDAGGKYYYEVYEQYFKEARKSGKDGVIVKNVIDNPRGEQRPIDVYIAFKNNQIKSVANIKPTADPDIRFSLSKETKNIDSEYMLAVENGDMETAQRLVNEAAEKAGYTTNEDYKISHYAPVAQIDKEYFTDLDKLQELYEESSDLNLFAVANGISLQPDDYFSPNGARWYMYDDAEGMESYRAIKPAMDSIQRQIQQYGEVQEMPTVKVYRAVPKSLKETKLQSGGQWVTPSYKYAVKHGNNALNGKYKIIEETVSAENLWWDGNDIREWGFDDGTDYAYRDTKNNRKLLDAVTYDDEGNVIPLSKRFNFRNEDERFSLSKEGEQPSTIGTPLKDLALEQDIAPVKETAPTRVEIPNKAKNTNVGTVAKVDDIAPIVETTVKAPMPNEITPMTEEEANALQDEKTQADFKTVDKTILEKIQEIETELEKLKRTRNESTNFYDAEIARLSAENSQENSSQIENLQLAKETIDKQLEDKINNLKARVKGMKTPQYGRAMRKKAKMQEHADWAADILGDTSTWKDKKIGLQYATNTERRNLRDIVRDENGNVDIAKADAIDDALNGQYNREEAAKKRELAQVRKKYADLKITKAESAYIQMLGELRGNPETTLTKKAVKEYYEQHKNKIDKAKVEKALEYARQDYDNLINRVNAELRNQGMKEIPYRQGYFPHFTEPKQNFIQKLLNWKVQDNEIPTSIAGLTESFKPVKSWQSFDKTRHSDTTDYDFLKGFDNYSQGALDWVYHLDTLQKRRAVENHIRFTHSEEGIKKRIKEVYANEELDANEAQAQIEHILTEAKNPLNNFVQDFTTHTNILAGKKNSLDRTAEQWTNRHIYSVMTNVQNRMSANMVLANVRSALTNFIPITQSWAQVSPVRSLQATKDTIANAIKDDGIINKSTFLTNRLREADNLYKTNWDKVMDKAGIMFEIVDNFSSQVIWRSKYSQNLANGMSESQAIKNADQFAENVMAGRSKGNEPTIFNAKNPFVKAFTIFQLEVNNQYGYLFKDVPNDLKAETEHWKFNLVKGYTTAFIGAYVYNALLEQVAGSGAALDPIGIIEDLLRDLGLFDDDEEEKEPSEIVGNFAENVAEELPFVGGLLGGGRIPISSIIPYKDEGFLGGIEAFTEDASETAENVFNSVKEGGWLERDWSGFGNIVNEAMNPLLNIGLPVGGGQLKKTVQGLKMFNTDEDHPIAGSYTDSGGLRFPVEDTLGNRIQAGIFGQWANENAREYIDNGYAPLSEEQTQEFIDVDIPIKDYRKYREGLKGKDTLGEKAAYISGLDLPISKKNLLINNIADREEPIDLTDMELYDDWGEFDYAKKYPDKYEFLKANNISAKEYEKFDEDTKEAYSWAYQNPEKFALSKVVTDDLVEYRQYASALNKIRADKDANGDSISGSAKEKKIDYINNLDLEYEQKIVMFKMQYPNDDTYNADIIDYINNREDLTFDERVEMYKALGFTVQGDTVYWD